MTRSKDKKHDERERMTAAMRRLEELLADPGPNITVTPVGERDHNRFQRAGEPTTSTNSPRRSRRKTPYPPSRPLPMPQRLQSRPSSRRSAGRKNPPNTTWGRLSGALHAFSRNSWCRPHPGPRQHRRRRLHRHRLPHAPHRPLQPRPRRPPRQRPRLKLLQRAAGPNQRCRPRPTGCARSPRALRLRHHAQPPRQSPPRASAALPRR